jgi:CheY-like chemotaxis protein
MTANYPLPQAAPVDEGAKPRLRLLVVDDEPDVCDLLSAALQATSSCSVKLAHDAKAALRALSDEAEPFDGIFLDIQMPGTTGIELCAIIRSTPGYEDVPIIMLTAMTERRFLHGAYARGADDYITKPFELDDIRAKLAKERWQRQRRNHLKAGRASYGAGGSQGGREVINALEDAVLLSSIDRCIRRDAFQNYLLQTKNRPGTALSIRAIKVAAIHDIFTRLSTCGIPVAHGCHREMRVELTGQSSEDVITHLGNGILLTACEGHSSLTKDGLHDGLEAAGVRQRLRAHDLSLRVILGEEFTSKARSDADILFMVSRAIEGAEKQEEKLSGWANFREWLSFRKSTGRERARIDQSAYEQILNEFIAEVRLEVIRLSSAGSGTGMHERRQAHRGRLVSTCALGHTKSNASMVPSIPSRQFSRTALTSPAWMMVSRPRPPRSYRRGPPRPSRRKPAGRCRPPNPRSCRVPAIVDEHEGIGAALPVEHIVPRTTRSACRRRRRPRARRRPRRHRARSRRRRPPACRRRPSPRRFSIPTSVSPAASPDSPSPDQRRTKTPPPASA